MLVIRRAHQSSFSPTVSKDPKPWKVDRTMVPVSLHGNSRTGWGPRAPAAHSAFDTDVILFVIISSTLPRGNGASEANLCAQDHRPVKIQPNRRGFECSCGNSSRLLPSHHKARTNPLWVTEMC